MSITTTIKKVEPESDEASAFLITYRVNDHPQNDIRVSFDKVGAMLFSENDFPKESVYLYPEQVQRLRLLLKEQAKAGTKKPHAPKSVSGYIGGRGKKRTIPIGNARVIDDDLTDTAFKA